MKNIKKIIIDIITNQLNNIKNLKSHLFKKFILYEKRWHKTTYPL